MNSTGSRAGNRFDSRPAFLAFLLLMFCFWHSNLNAGTQPDLAGSQPGIAETYQPYAELLDRFLIEQETGQDSGLVSAFDYQEALRNPKTEKLIRQQKNNLRTFDTGSLNSKERALSFWINAYNFFMLAHILENPKQGGKWIDSVKDYGNFINPYQVFKKEIFNIGGKQYSLDIIEKEILFGEDYKKRCWKDARVHFAVNCASVGCPPLRKSIYKPDNLYSLLTKNTRLALQTPRHFHVSENTLYLTQLFEWYEDDFVEAAGSVRAFLKRYTTPEINDKIENTEAIRYIDYDWALNRPGNFHEISKTSAREHDDTQS